MAIDFPDSPSVNDTYVAGGKTYKWDGTAWEIYGPNFNPDILYTDTTNNRVGINNTSPTVDLDVTGDAAISGGLTVDTDTIYVDSANDRVGINTASPSQNLDVIGNTQLRDVYMDSVANWNYGQLQISRNASNTANTKIVSVLLDGDSPDDTDFYANVNVALRTDSAPTSGSTSSALNAGVEITAPDSVRFGTNGGEKMRISSSGNVGIGTTTPETPLTIDTTNKLGSSFTGTTAGEGLRVVQTDYTSGNYVSLVEGTYDDNSTDPHVRIGAMYDGGGSQLSFGTSNSYGSGITNEALSITSEGNVGIGTASPSQKLDVSGNVVLPVGSGIMFDRGGSDSHILYKETASGSTYGTGDDVILRNPNGADLLFQTSGSNNRLTITSNGHVGIGTTSPSAQLTVKAASTGTDDGTVEFHSWSGSPTSPTEVEDWPVPVLSLRAYDNFNRQSFLSFGYPNDPVYKTDNSVWNFRLETSGGNATASTTSTHLELYGPGTFKTGDFTTNGGKSFTIAHPLPELRDTHDLRHSVVESPQADNMYRGQVALVGGMATVNLDEAAGMSEGTFVLLNRDVQCFTSNEDGWTALRGSVSGNVLTIEAQDASCNDNVSWLVVGERQDDDIKASPLTDDEGHIIVEPLTTRATEEELAASIARMEAAKQEAV